MQKAKFLLLIWTIILTFSWVDSSSANSILLVAPDSQVTYSRTLFKHWVDADKDGCDTRAEVLIEEATIKPKIGKKCALTGGSWLSPYDNKVQTKASSLDIDHLVPLAEAWRSGAWKWTASQREAFANDLNNKEALVAVTLSLNRSKGDKDVSGWLPPVNQCTYIRDWIVVKLTYGLTVDSFEATKLNQAISSCGITGVTIERSNTDSPNQASSPTPSASTTSGVEKFKMPFILGDGKLGNAKSKWKSYGFVNPPIIVQQPSSLKDYSCKPISDDDWISEVSPKWDSLVDVNTQVTITTMCTLDLQSPKSPSPTSSPTVSSSQSPTPSPTPSVVVTRVPSPTSTSTPSNSSSPTPSLSPTPTPTPTPTVTRSPSPTATSSISWPQDSSARCKDGTFSYSKTRSGTCSGHGGVDTWRNP